MKQRITLIFPSLYALWSFAQEIKVTSMEINTSKKSLICECKTADIELAKNKYGATLAQ